MVKVHETLNATGKSWSLVTRSDSEGATLEATFEIRGTKGAFNCKDQTTDMCLSQFLLHLSKQ